MVWGLIGLGLAIGVFLGRLSTGPVVLDWMKPRIEEALTPGSAEVDVAIGRTELRLSSNHQTVEIVGIDVRYLDEDKQAFLSFPEVKVALSVEAFLKTGLITASRVEAQAPTLQLTRTTDGSFGLYSIDGDDDQDASDVDFVAFLKHFMVAPKSDDRIAYLKRLQIKGASVVYTDQRRTGTIDAEAADLVLIRRDDGVSGWLRADLVQEESRTAIQLLGRVDEETERIKMEMMIENMVVADMAATWQADFPSLPEELMAIDAPIEARIKGEIGLDGELSPLQVEMKMIDGVLDLPKHLSQPLPVTLGELNGSMAASFDRFTIDQFRLVSLGSELIADGHVIWQESQKLVDLDLEAKNVSAEDLPIFWPLDLGKDGRDWVVENIKTGVVSRASAKLELREGDFGPDPLRDEALKGSFAFEGLSVRYVDTMPPVENGAGTASFDADRLHFEVSSGSSADVEIKGGTVTITGVGKPGREATQLKVLANVQGSIDRGLALLDYPPLDVAKDLEIPPERTEGGFDANIDVRMPLHDDVTEEEVDVLADATLSEVVINRLPRLGNDVQLSDGAFQLTVGLSDVTLDGTAVVADLPLAIRVDEPLVEGTTKRRILLDGTISTPMLEKFGLATYGVEGALAFDATLTETDDNIWIDLDADLTDLVIALPGLAWQKAAGVDGTLKASVAVPNEAPIEVKQFELLADSLSATGSLQVSQQDYEIQSLSLDQIKLDDSLGTLHIEGGGKSTRSITVVAEFLDLDRLLAADGDHGIDVDFGRLHIAMRADRVLYKGLDLQDTQADASHRDNTWRTASFLGSLAGGGKVALELAPEGDVQRLDIRSDDAGALIHALDLGRRVQGGNLHLSATISSQNPIKAAGRLEIDSFTLADAPLLARLLTVASLTGLGNLLDGEGIDFDNLILPFSVEGKKLGLTDGLLRGSQLGLTTMGTIDFKSERMDLAGTVIPIYSLNRLLGKVPIIGRILTGADGPGAFAATYKIEGANNRPTVYVNPLSILAPGLLRDFFGGLANGAAASSNAPKVNR